VSYLDVPRLHFSGRFFSDVSTINNTLGSCCDPASGVAPSDCVHDNTVVITPAHEGWNPNGRHWFYLDGCTVKSVVDFAGTAHTTAAGDGAVTGTVESTNTPSFARMVDLDPSHQFSSQIWGLNVRVSTPGGGTMTATMLTATMRDLWWRRVAGGGGMPGAAGSFQSVLTPVTWAPAAGSLGSTVLEDLRTRSPTRLSIKFVLYAYDPNPGPGFRFGRVVGTIGPADPAEPNHFIADRRLIHAGTSGTPFGAVQGNSAQYNVAPFKVDARRRKLVVDLGNAIPETSPAGPRAPAGPLIAFIIFGGGTPSARLGTLQFDTAHYLETAGVEEVALTAQQLTDIGAHRLVITDSAPNILIERRLGTHVDVSESVVRLNPGQDHDIELIVSRRGRRLAGQQLFVGPSRVGGTMTGVTVLTGAPAFGTTLTLTPPAAVTTDANGTVKLRLRGTPPGHPRAHLDGQLSYLGFFVFGSNQAHLRGEVAIQVFEGRAMPALPTWAHVEPILQAYSRLYPSMRAIYDLAVHSVVQTNRVALADSMDLLLRPETAPNHMPVTRDLSRDKRALILAWLRAGAPL
jgi:hypothetical protein